MYKETKSRSIIKMISWRFLATLTTTILVFIFVGELEVAITVGVLEVIIKMFVYFVHERVWNSLKFGKYEVKPFVLWFTGLPLSGKTALASKTYDYLIENGYRAERIEGKDVRILFPKTDFSREGREMHIQRIGHLVSILEKNGVIVSASFVSPYRDARHFVRDLCQDFVEIYVKASPEVCEKRDKEGLYARARSGEIPNFTGVSDPYEEPENPDLIIDTEKLTIEESLKQIKKFLAPRL
jgi:adenylylsulfate kinase